MGTLSDNGAWSHQTRDLYFSFEAKNTAERFEVIKFTGTDEIFECFQINIDLVSECSDINISDLLDTEAVLTVEKRGEQPRYFHGSISEIERSSSGHSRTLYRVVLRPSLHRLNFVSDSRIFQAMTVPDIAKEILSENGIVNVHWDLESSGRMREFCVCYQERLFDFLQRLLAEEGMFFWFEHSRGGHRLVFSDKPHVMRKLSEAGFITYNGSSGGASQGSWISRFAQTERLRASHRKANDYTFQHPKSQLDTGPIKTEENHGGKDRVLYQYPGGYDNLDIGKQITKIALDAHRVDAITAEGETNCVHLCSGFIFTLTDHFDEKVNVNYRLLKVHHEGSQLAALEEDAPDDTATTYRASFTCQPERLPYRGMCSKPRPRINDAQIAHVTGPEGQEISCDEYGRVRVWFPWDIGKKNSEKTSCWVRVMQPSAGKNMGQVAVPRVGDEVVIIFLDGDPDRPIIAGSAYNKLNPVPYLLPDNQTKMVIRSNIVGAREDSNGQVKFNELSFENKAGEEEILLHSAGNKLEMIAKKNTVIQAQSLGENARKKLDGVYQGFLTTMIVSSILAPVSIAALVVSQEKARIGKEVLKKRK